MSFALKLPLGLLAVLTTSICSANGSERLPVVCYLVDIDIFYNYSSQSVLDFNLPEMNKTVRKSVFARFVSKTWPDKSKMNCDGVNVVYRDMTLKSVIVSKVILAATFLYVVKDGVERDDGVIGVEGCINATRILHDEYIENYNFLTSMPTFKGVGGSNIKAYAAKYGSSIRPCCVEDVRYSCCSEGSSLVLDKEHDYCECNPGHYDDKSKSSLCQQCPKGTYKSRPGMAQCEPCPEGRTTIGEGATSCIIASECKKQVTWEAQGVFSWENTKGGTRAKHACPYGPENVTVIRDCLLNQSSEASWGKLDMSVCKSSNRTTSLLRLSKTAVNESNTLKISTLLVWETEMAKELNAYDVALATVSLTAIIDVQDSLAQVSDNVMKVLNNILMVSGEILSESQRHNRTASRLVNATEKFAENIPLLNGSRSLVAPNIELSLQAITSEMLLEGFAFNVEPRNNSDILSNKSSIAVPPFMTISPKALHSADQQGSRRLVSIIYRNNKLFPVLTNDDVEEGSNASVRTGSKTRVGNVVLAGKFKGALIKGIQDAVELSFVQHTKSKRRQVPRCVYWDFGSNYGFGNWSSDGCHYVGTKLGHVICRCNHLTNFAMLLTADAERYESDADHRNALNILSYVGCGVSLLATILTLLTYTLFRHLRRSNAQLILCHLCVALIGLLVSFLVVGTRTPNTTTCRAFSLLVHYFLLATFTWMGVEGVNMYLAFVKVMSAHVPRFMPKAIVISWGVPALVVIVTGSVAFDDYSSEKSCFIHGLAFYLSVFPLAIAVLLDNFVMFGLTMYSLSRMGKKVSQENTVQGCQRVKIALAIMVLLGLTWLFGFIAIGGARLVFQYVFCIFNSLQGFAIFWFHCVRQAEVRECWTQFICKRGSRKRRYTASTTVPALKKSTPSPKLSSYQRPDRVQADTCDKITPNVDQNLNSTNPV